MHDNEERPIVEAGTRDRTASPAGTPAGTNGSYPGAARASGYASSSDEALVRRARAGEFTAFDALVARHSDMLYALAIGSLRNEADAVDAVCEAAVAAFRDIDSADAPRMPGTWLWLHGFSVVFRRLKPRPGGYTVVRRCMAAIASSALD